jgi:hypothetical protein
MSYASVEATVFMESGRENSASMVDFETLDGRHTLRGYVKLNRRYQTAAQQHADGGTREVREEHDGLGAFGGNKERRGERGDAVRKGDTGRQDTREKRMGSEVVSQAVVVVAGRPEHKYQREGKRERRRGRKRELMKDGDERRRRGRGRGRGRRGRGGEG